MPRPSKDESGAEPKKRSRTGCWPCKARKVKCGEEKPRCTNCSKSGESCDYSIRLNWGGRARRDKDGFTFVATPTSVTAAKSSGHGHEHVFSSQHIATVVQPSGSQPSSGNTSGLPPTPEPTPREDNGIPQADVPSRVSFQNTSPGHLRGALTRLPPLSGGRHLSDGSPPTSAPADVDWSSHQAAKRVRLSPRTGEATSQPHWQLYADLSPPGSTYFTPSSVGSLAHTPATPSSSVNSTSPLPLTGPPLHSQESADLRRLSVKSLLSDPTDEVQRPRHTRTASHGQRAYGYDHGLPDEDIPRNDDRAAIRPKSPDLRRTSVAVSDLSTSSCEPDPREMAFEPGGYYARPVSIRIPKALEPLPAELTENPMNLLYFHHFINHTGRIMVPHDCPDNPMRGVLPQMAVRNKQMLHLLLAFSASHRARLLNHPEPANRIAEWMDDVLPALRAALDEPASSIGSAKATDLSSLAPLATAIMLASLEIISPNTFAVPISWQNHLDVARRLIIAKGGLQPLARKSDGARDRTVFFLSRWFAYLDVLGSLSGGGYRRPLCDAYMEDGGGLWLVNRNDDEVFRIDCFFGFSGRCIALLASVAELAAACDRQRIDPASGRQRAGWHPTQSVRERARELSDRLNASARCVYRGCMHVDPGGLEGAEEKSREDVDEIFATNEAYHWAGLIHLSRRVLGLPRQHPEVQESVRKILRSLSKVRRGSTAEPCLLFPMFTAGCEALADDERAIFMERLRAVEGWGMQQVSRARTIMQKVWDTGVGWEGLVHGEFLG